jgi:hypothetical protein
VVVVGSIGESVRHPPASPLADFPGCRNGLLQLIQRRVCAKLRDDHVMEPVQLDIYDQIDVVVQAGTSPARFPHRPGDQVADNKL